MLEIDTLKNGTSHIDLYGCAPRLQSCELNLVQQRTMYSYRVTKRSFSYKRHPDFNVFGGKVSQTLLSR